MMQQLDDSKLCPLGLKSTPLGILPPLESDTGDPPPAYWSHFQKIAGRQNFLYFYFYIYLFRI